MIPKLGNLAFIAFDKDPKSGDKPTDTEMLQVSSSNTRSKDEDKGSVSVAQQKNQIDADEMDDLLHETFGGQKEKEFKSSAEIDEQRKEQEAQNKRLSKNPEKSDSSDDNDNMTIAEHYALAKKQDQENKAKAEKEAKQKAEKEAAEKKKKEEEKKAAEKRAKEQAALAKKHAEEAKKKSEENVDIFGQPIEAETPTSEEKAKEASSSDEKSKESSSSESTTPKVEDVKVVTVVHEYKTADEAMDKMGTSLAER